MVITTIGLLLSVALSLTAFNYIINYQAKDSLRKQSAFIEEKIAEINSLKELNEFLDSQNSNAFCITVLSSDFRIIGDNNYTNLQPNKLEKEKYIQKAAAGEKNFKIGNPYTTGESMIMYTTRVENSILDSGGHIIVRYSTQVFYNNKPFWFLIATASFIWVFIAVVSFVTIQKSLKEITDPLLSIQYSLENISRGKFEKAQLSSVVDQEEFMKIFNSINDISEQISESMNDLQSEQRKSNFLLQSINQGVIAVSKNCKVILTNNAVLNIFDQQSNIVGESLGYLIQDAEIIEKIQEAVYNKSYYVGSIQINNKNYRIETVNIKDGWANFIGAIEMMVVMTDITQESKSATIRSEFFANASHELKTPLTAIRGYSEILAATKDKKRVDKCAMEINENSMRMLNLIDDMLKLSRLDAEMDTEEISKINLGELCRKICLEQEVSANIKGIKMICDGETFMFGRKNMISMLISNLVNNAIKYNVQNGTVTVRNYLTDNKLIISVQDTGIGIEPKQQGRVFERFFMVDFARNKENNNSTGIGLAIVKHIAVIHGAEIELISKVGEGTIITVIFPIPKN